MNPRASTTGSAAVSVLLVLVGLGLAWGVWEWFFCRFYVPIDHMAIITAKEGDPLPSGQILARKGQKGVLEEPLGEGRHFLNPYLYEWQIVPTVTIPAGKVGVVTCKVGTDLPEGEFLAEPGQKGIWRNVLSPGKYRLNPCGYDISVVDAISIPIGYVGVITSLSGSQAPEGEFAGPKQKGVRREVLHPGLYYLNPKEFRADVIEIGLNQVSITGKEGGQVRMKGELDDKNVAMRELAKNVLEQQKQKRQHYLEAQQQAAPLAQEAAPAGGRPGPQRPGSGQSAAVAGQPPAQPRAFVGEEAMSTLALSQFVEFPSRDGFEIRLDMTVEFELLPKDIAMVFRSYGDLPAVVDKIIMPQILSVSRLKGSSYGAKDFIMGEGREKFQNDLTETLANVLKEKHLTVHNALIRHVIVPEEILQPIQQAGLAIEQDLTNKERQKTAKTEAEFNTQEGMIEQRRQEVEQETERLCAEIKADEKKEVASILAEAERGVADIAKQTAVVRAEITLKAGEADAKAIELVQGEEARGFLLRAQAMGDPAAYTAQEFAEKLSPELTVSIIHAGEGTLWTDLQSARLGDLAAAGMSRRPAPPKPGSATPAAGTGEIHRPEPVPAAP